MCVATSAISYFLPQKPLLLDEKESDPLVHHNVNLKILSYLTAAELGRCSRVNKKWKALVSEDADVLWKALIPSIAFGKKQWDTYFGDIGEAPPLPRDIHKILKSSCPFWPEKKIEDTHMLVLIPETIDGKPFDFETLLERVKSPKEGFAVPFRYIYDTIIKQYGKKSTKAHWVLMTKDVIPNSRKKSYAEQKALVADWAKKTGIDYEVPNLFRAATCILLKYLITKEHLFNDEPIRCQEEIEGYQVAVVGFAPTGFRVDCHNYDFDNFGVAVLRSLGLVT